MYSRGVGAHQKIDRVARRHLSKLLSDDSVFPKAREIILFEGKNGPDGIKVKSPGKDEPWHFVDPFDDTDTKLTDSIQEHYKNLVKELKIANKERAAFEAAWLAHAIVDGLTPAHHYPYEEKLAELRLGQDIETRNSIKEKLVMHGENRREKVRNNWRMWGARGLVSTHLMFELGVATLIKPLNFKEAMPSRSDLRRVNTLGVVEMFNETLKEIATLKIYENYYKKGWTPRLAWQVRHKLGPAIVQTVTLAWYAALKEAELT